MNNQITLRISKKVKSIYSIFTFLLFLSCAQEDSYNASGIVYSRHRVPMPKIEINITYAQGGKDQVAGSITLVTDSNGYYKFVRRGRLKGQYGYTYLKETRIYHKDSGSYNVTGFPNAQNYEIHLK